MAIDGDDLERRSWPLFVRREFPSYERFWYVFVAPLTNRVKNRSDVHFRSDSELASMTPPRGFYDLYLAQLNYSVLWHLTAVYDMRATGASTGWDSQLFVSAILRLCSALDVADELLQRDAEGTLPNDPWGHRALKARRTWREKHPSPTFLTDLQDYRHQLVHSGPFMHWGEGPHFPKVGQHRDYRDWRKATASFTDSELAHFEHASVIVEEAWAQTIRYLQTSWRQLLSRHGKHRTPLPRVRRLASRSGVAGPGPRAIRSTTEPQISIGKAALIDVQVLDALVESRTRTATTEPVFRMPPAEYWATLEGIKSASSATRLAPILSGSLPEEVTRSLAVEARRRTTRRRPSKTRN
ncbi:MAG: hypothetical protein ACYDA0_14610 [Candidatus Dormibacteraceae bacterium]